MSSSAASAADTDSSILSRPEKRSLTPSDSPQNKRLKPEWENDEAKSVDESKVQLPSIFTTFEDTHRNELRRASLPTLHSESRLRHSPYPSPHLRHQNYAPANQSALSTYTFPPVNEDEKGRPRLSTDINFGMPGYDSPSGYMHSSASTGMCCIFFW